MTSSAVLLMAYGTPNSTEDIEPYLTDIRRGIKPTRAAVEDLSARYQRIGGKSPLLEITKTQASAVERELTSRGMRTRVYIGMKHWHPYIREIVPQIFGDGFDRILGVVLAPHYSQISVGTYKRALQDAVETNSGQLRTDFVDSWYDHPLFHKAVKEQVQATLEQFAEPDKVELVFTAHSLPERILAMHDPYPTQLESSCRSVAELLRRREWAFAYQSAGQTNEKWLGPDLVEYLRSRHWDHSGGVLVAPIGFVADHLEILYDIDIEAKEFARSINLELKRSESLNTSPTFISALTEIVLNRL